MYDCEIFAIIMLEMAEHSIKSCTFSNNAIFVCVLLL